MAVAFENLTMTGVEALLKWGVAESFAASVVGVNVPLSKIPLAWAKVTHMLAKISPIYKAGTLTWAKSRMFTKHRMELGQQLMAGLHNLLV
jgi:hypothetical protein